MAPAGAAAASNAAAHVAARTILRMVSSFKKWLPTRPNTLVSVERCDSIRSLTEQLLKLVFSVPRAAANLGVDRRRNIRTHARLCVRCLIFVYYRTVSLD
jgi:hypothetical protein